MEHKAPSRQYRVSVRFAYDPSVGHELPAFAHRKDAEQAAERALEAYRCTYARVSRERWTEHLDLFTGQMVGGWTEDGELRQFSRYLKPEER